MSQSSMRRRILKWALIALGILMILLFAAVLFVCRTALYHRFVLFPNEVRAWQSLQEQRTDTTLYDGWKQFRGVCHSHSELSHDSAISFPEIVRNLKIAKVDFICMSEHYDDGKADYSRGWTGVHDGILFIRGYEMNNGYMPWGIPEGTIFSAKDDPLILAKRIRELGGLLFYAHCEHERNWDLPELNGMEIYNTHADLMDERLASLVPDILINLRAYPDQTLRLVYDRQTDLLKRWDDVNKIHKLVGIAANDCHQNVGIRAIFTAQNTLQLRGTGEKTEIEKEIPVGFFKRAILRCLFGPLTPDKELFRIDLDPYERSCRYVNTHVLAKECSEKAILESMAQGRVFVAFNMLADASGFKYMAQGKTAHVVMGEEIPYEPGLLLRSMSPVSCRFRIVRDGVKMAEYDGVSFDWEVKEPGRYRVEAELNIVGEWTPWIYTNPLTVIEATPQK